MSLDLTQTKLKQIRDQYMSNRRILCTGNPNGDHTIASGIKQIIPNVDFVHLSNGWDLTFPTADSENDFSNLLKNYNTLINCSFIKFGCQEKILNLSNNTWKHGHVITIGSNSEYDPANFSNPEFAKNKLSLRNRSLALNNYRFRTSYIVLGGIHDSQPDHSEWMTPVEIAQYIHWIINQPVDIPLLGIQSPGAPW